jgi:hypothetical protein
MARFRPGFVEIAERGLLLLMGMTAGRALKVTGKLIEFSLAGPQGARKSERGRAGRVRFITQGADA